MLLGGKHIRHNDDPVYLAITLDSTLSYKEHLQNTASKLKSRNILLMKLAGSSWVGMQMPGPYGCPPWLFAIQQQSTVLQSDHIQLTLVSLMSS